MRADSHFVLLGVDAATTGRLSVIFSREYFGTDGNELIERIEQWHRDCAWNVSSYNKKLQEHLLHMKSHYVLMEESREIL